METFKGTKGKLTVSEIRFASCYVAVVSEGGLVARFFYENTGEIFPETEAVSNANIFVEVVTVANETNQTPRQLKEELECAVILLQMDIDSLELSNMDFYNKYGFNVAERMDKTRLFLTSIENKRK